MIQLCALEDIQRNKTTASRGMYGQGSPAFVWQENPISCADKNDVTLESQERPISCADKEDPAQVWTS